MLKGKEPKGKDITFVPAKEFQTELNEGSSQKKSSLSTKLHKDVTIGKGEKGRSSSQERKRR